MFQFKAPVKKAAKVSKLDVQLQKILSSSKKSYDVSPHVRFGEINAKEIIDKINSFGSMAVNSPAFENMVSSMYFSIETKKTNTNIIRFALQNNNQNNKFGFVIQPRNNKQYCYSDILIILGCINFSEHKYKIVFDNNYKFAEFLKFLRIKKNLIYSFIMYTKRSPNRLLLND